MSLRVKAECDDNSKDNRCFHDVNPQCPLRKSQNNIRFRHDFTQWRNRTIEY